MLKWVSAQSDQKTREIAAQFDHRLSLFTMIRPHG